MARRYFLARVIVSSPDPEGFDLPYRIEHTEVTLDPDILLERGIDPDAHYEANRGRKDYLVDVNLPKKSPTDLTHTLRTFITSVSFTDEEVA